jgi:hypothetical protein
MSHQVFASMKPAVWLATLGACFSAPTRPGAGDGGVTGGDAVDAVADARFESPANYMFVTKNRINANTLSMPGVADMICRNQAAAAGLPDAQSFYAWFSDLNISRDAIMLLGSSRGWVRPDGRPFADTISDIQNGKLLYPPRLDADGNEAFVDQEFVATGTGANGLAAVNCNLGGGGSLTIGVNDAASPLWTDVFDNNCSNDYKHYCFGTGRQHDVSPMIPADGLRAFVSAPTAFVTLGDLDTVCATEAMTAGLQGTYLALVAATTKAPRGRIDNVNNKAWYRLDGVRITGPAMVGFDAPLNLTSDNNYVQSTVWFGSLSPAMQAASTADNCNNWLTADGSTTSAGESVRSSSGAFKGFGNVPCNGMRSVYCFQSEL